MEPLIVNDKFSEGEVLIPALEKKEVAPLDEEHKYHHIRRAWNVTDCVLQGNYLPLFTDKMRNNLRSRWMLAALYAVAAAFVLTLLVLAFEINDDKVLNMSFSTPPPVEVAVGVPFSLWSVRIANGENQGLEGAVVVAALTPIDPIPLSVTMLQGNIATRSIDCIATLLLLGSTSVSSDSLYCAPQSFNLLLSRYATTNKRGIATFRGMTLTFGFPGSYLLVVKTAAGGRMLLTSFVSVKADSLNITLPNPAPLFDLSAPAGYLTIQGNLSPFSVTVFWYCEETPTTVGAAVISLDLQNPIGISPSVPIPVSDTPLKYVNMAGNWNTSSAITSLGGNLYRTTLYFDSLSVLGTNTNQMFLGVAFMNRIVPLSSIDNNIPGSSPNQIVLMFSPLSEVQTVIGQGVSLLQSFLEGSLLNSVTLTTIDANGLVLPSRMAFLYLKPSPDRNPSKTGNDALNHPSLLPKSIPYNIAVSNMDGVSMFPHSLISVSGAIGFYDLHAVVDGVLAVWPGNFNRTSMPIFVDTSVSYASMVTVPPNLNPTETVGEPWVSVPAVVLYNSAAQPVPGKIVSLIPQNDQSVGIFSKVTVTNGDGLAVFLLVNTQFAWPNTTQYTFNLQVDDVIIGSINKTIAHTNATRASTSCSRVVAVLFQSVAIVGLPSFVTLQGLDASGNPVPAGVSYFAEIPAKYLPPQPGSNTTLYSLIANDTGNAVLPTTANGISGSFAIGVYLYCSINAPLEANYGVLQYKTRIQSVRSVNSTDSVSVIVDADWSLVPSGHCIPVVAQLVLFPTYAESYLPNDDLPQLGAGCAYNNTQVVVLSAPSSVLQGLFAYSVNVDSAPFPIFQSLFFLSNVAFLQVARSAFEGVIEVGTLWTVQPVVLLLASDGTPVEGRRMFAQIGLQLSFFPNSTSWSDPFSETESVVIGGLLNGSNLNIKRPYSLLSNASGHVVFVGLEIIAALVAPFQLRIRYCLHVNAPLNDGTTESLCVEEVPSTSFSFGQQVQYTITPQVLSGTQGLAVVDVTITGRLYNGQALPAMFCVPVVEGVTRPLLQFVQVLGATYGAFFTPGTTLTISNSMFVLDDAASGTYSMYFLCPGSRTGSVQLVVSSTPAAMKLILPPPGLSYLNMLYPVQVRVVGQSGRPLKLIAVELQLVPKNSSCQFTSCGVIDPLSNVWVQTDSTGTALLTIALAAGLGPYTLKAVLSPQPSSKGIRQTAARQIDGYCQLVGVNQEQLPAMVSSRSPEFFQVLNVLQSLIHSTPVTSDSPEPSSFNPFAPPAATPVTAAFDIFIPNPVYQVICLSPVEGYSIDLIVTDPTAIINTVTQFDIAKNDAPLLLLLDSNGSPVSGSVTVSVIVEGGSFLALTPGSSVDLDSIAVNGTVLFHPLRLQAIASGNFYVYFTSQGSMGCKIPVTVAPSRLISRTDWMKYVSAFLCLFFSPMLLGSVPHSRAVYLIVGNVVSVGATVGLFFLEPYVPKNFYYHAYFYLMVTMLLLVDAIGIGIMVFDLLGYCLGIPFFRFVNDEAKALTTFEYVQWILFIRPEKQPKVVPFLLMRNVEKLKQVFIRRAGRLTAQVTKIMGRNITLNTRRRKTCQRPALQYTQPDPIYPPSNFIIVLSITFVLVVLVTLLMIYLFQYLLMKIGVFLTYLPDLSEQTQAEIQQVNVIFVLALTNAIELVVLSFPQFSVLGAIIKPLRQLDLLRYLSTVRSLVEPFLLRLSVAFITGTALGTIVVIVVAVTTFINVPDIIRNVRRGLDPGVPCNVGSCEGYIGLHCMHFMIVHQIVAWPVMLTVFIVSIEFLRVFILDLLKPIIVASLVSYVTQYIIQLLVVRLFLAEGSSYAVVRPEFYSIWHFVGLILGIFTSLMKSVVRWVTALGFVTLLFARLDIAIFPAVFASSDAAHNGFRSIVILEAKNGNPLYLMFATLLILHNRLQTLADMGESTVEIDSFLDSERGLSSVVRNMARIYLRSVTGNPRSLRKSLREGETTFSLSAFKNSKVRLVKEKVRTRFWLWYFLTKHPQFVPLRKHNLFEKDDEDRLMK